MNQFLIFFAATFAIAACDSSKGEAPTPVSDPSHGAGAHDEQANEKAHQHDDNESHHQQRVSVSVGASGYEPSSVEARAGAPITLVFKRTTDQGCGDELVFPDRDIRHDLPLNQEVEVEFTPQANETIAFTCGMGMYRGSVVAAVR